MKIVSIKNKGKEGAAIIIERGYVRIDTLNEEKRSFWPEDYKSLISSPQLPMLLRWYNAGGRNILENLSRKLIVENEDAEIVSEVFTAGE